MKENYTILYISIGVSLILHLSIFYSISWDKGFDAKRIERKTALVAVNLQPPPKAPEKVVVDLPEPPPVNKPLPVPVEKPKVKTSLKSKTIKKVIRPTVRKPETPQPPPKKVLPPSNKPASAKSSSDSENVKPVFGLSPDSMSKSGESSMAVRTGNTLMQEQEEEFTPPEEVKSYTSIPVFELSTLPIPRHKVDPQYPSALKKKEIEGSVLLAATIDEHGKVVKLSIKRSDHELFSQAAIIAMKQFTFKPGEQNGKPVATTIDYTIKFILDE